MGQLTASDLMAFELEVKEAFEDGKIRGPVHLAGGNEAELIRIFQLVRPGDWVFATYRSHFHALLHGIPRERVMAEIMAGRSMNLSFPEYRFVTSAIVGGCLPIAVGVAAAIKRKKEPNQVWCFVGDMAASIGTFHDAYHYATRHDLLINFVIEDNGLSCDSPTEECWGLSTSKTPPVHYFYKRQYPHVGTGKFIQF